MGLGTFLFRSYNAWTSIRTRLVQVGAGGDDGVVAGEISPIFYKK